MKTYVLMKHDRTIVKWGTSKVIGELLGVTRQAISKACNGSGSIQGYLIESYPHIKPTRRSKNWYLGKSLELLKSARVIIDEYNKELIKKNEYANVNIIMRIDKLLREVPNASTSTITTSTSIPV